MERNSFEVLVAEAVEGLPAEFLEKLENIDVVVEGRPSRGQLRQSNLGPGMTLEGLYEGVPLTRRDSNYGLVPPDKITIFQEVVEAVCGSASAESIKAEIQKVVRHEIAHHFGIGDEWLSQVEREHHERGVDHAR